MAGLVSPAPACARSLSCSPPLVVGQAHRKDFKDLVGVTWWMWFVVVAQTMVDGYLASTYPWAKMISTFVSVCLLSFVVFVAATFHSTATAATAAPSAPSVVII